MGDIAESKARWAEWLTDDGAIAVTVGRLEVDRDRWALLQDKVAGNASIPRIGDTLGWFWFHYACDAAVRLRRLGDMAKGSASLGRLLDEIAGQARLLTRQAYLDEWRDAVGGELWELIHEHQANSFFDEFAGVGREAVDPALVAVDQARLKEVLDPIRVYVNKRLAHHDPAREPSLTYEQISRGIDTVGELYRKYVRLVRRVELPEMPPVDNTSWGEAFTEPWLPASLPASEDEPG